MKKQAKSDVISIIGMVVGALLIVGALAYLGYIMWQYHLGKAEYRDLQELVFDRNADNGSDKGTGAKSSNGNQTVAEDSAMWAVDAAKVQQALGELKEQNSDIVGWIAFENMELSYPIMWCGDDEYYLRHTFSGEINSSGSIFMEANNQPDFEDYHTIIYGHNMRNLSMFGRLKNYKTKDFYEGNEYFVIYTENSVYRYRIFSYYDISEESDVYTVGFGPDENYRNFVNKMLKRSYYDTGVEVTEQDKIITLSTCSTEGNRFVVHAKRVDEL